jgi:hypothetical protein
MDLNAAYTYTRVGDTEPTTWTPVIKTRTRNVTLTIISRITSLLADRIDAITDERQRRHTLTVLESASIYLCDEPRPDFSPEESRDGGRIVTSYRGTPQIPVSVVLDLAEQIRTELA